MLDLASGTGDLCIDLARGGIRPISIDLSFGMLVGGSLAACPACRPTSCACRSRSRSVDGVTCGFALRNLADLPTFFAELARVVRPGGRIALLDVERAAATRSSVPGTTSTSATSCHGSARPSQRRRGLPVPAEERRLPAVARRDGRDAGHGGLRGRPPHPVERRSHATPRGHPLGPPRVGYLAPSGVSSRAWVPEIPDEHETPD